MSKLLPLPALLVRNEVGHRLRTVSKLATQGWMFATVGMLSSESALYISNINFNAMHAAGNAFNKLVSFWGSSTLHSSPNLLLYKSWGGSSCGM